MWLEALVIVTHRQIRINFDGVSVDRDRLVDELRSARFGVTMGDACADPDTSVDSKAEKLSAEKLSPGTFWKKNISALNISAQITIARKSACVVHCLLILQLATFASLAAAPKTAHWPQWRGPGRNAVSTETGLLKSWEPQPPNLVWQASGLGVGYASVVTSAGTIYTIGRLDNAGRWC